MLEISISAIAVIAWAGSTPSSIMYMAIGLFPVDGWISELMFLGLASSTPHGMKLG